MKLLAIETSTRQLGVALLDGEQLLSSYEVLADYPHAVELPGAVTRVLQAARITLSQLEGIAVDIGPGSFTGLRIGLAFVKALVFSRKIPVVGVSSLDVLAAGAPCAEGLVSPVLDAKQKNVYLARYQLEQGRPKRVSEYLLGRIETLVPELREPITLLGDGCAVYREQLLARCPKARIAAQEFWLPRAATVARLGHERLARGEGDDPARIVPLYLYPLDCSVRGPDRLTAVLPKVASAI